MTEDVELWWDNKNGWNLLVPALVPDSALYEMMKHAVPHYVRLWSECVDPKRKEKIYKMIKLLERVVITQHIMKGGDSHEKEGKKEEKRVLIV